MGPGIHRGRRVAADMKTTLHSQLLRTVRRYSMFQPGDAVGVALSAGADSTALLLLLDELRQELGITLKVLHLNHCLRGAESDGDEQFARELAGARHIEFFSRQVDIAAEARRRHWNLEDAARRFRYAFFESLVRRESSQPCGRRAHLRRSGRNIAGKNLARDWAARLGGHPPDSRGHRPASVGNRGAKPCVTTLRAKNQNWREDASNNDRTRDRARLRHDWLPHLERDFGPGVVERLAETSRIAAAEENFWTAIVDQQVAALVERDSGEITVTVAALLSPMQAIFGKAPDEPRAKAGQLALTRRIVVRLLENTAGERARFTSRHVESVVKLASEGASNQRVHLPRV